QNPKVGFAKDVMPIFHSCWASTCHGSTVGNPNGVFLGGNDPTVVHDGLVDVRSSELPTMSFVKPGDPRESYLMLKIDGSSCLLSGQCTGSDCGKRMPRDADQLPVETRDVVRRWIAQGAKND